MDRRAIVELVEEAARLAGAGKAGEARAAGADAPRWDGDAERHHRAHQRLDRDSAPAKLARQRLVVLGERGLDRAVLFGDKAGLDAEAHCLSSLTPPSLRAERSNPEIVTPA